MNNNVNSLHLFKTLLKSFNKQLVKNEWLSLINNTNNLQPHQIFQLDTIPWTFSNNYPTINKIRIIFIKTYLSNNLIPTWTNFIYFNFINCMMDFMTDTLDNVTVNNMVNNILNS
tara:strand:- start:161 stop:505 length:345 start_codon:yes stop_codon:yes gene_type:complete